MVEKCPLLLFNSNSQDLQQLVNDLVTRLKDEEGRVSPSSCVALMSVIKAAYSVAMAQQKVSTMIKFAYKNSHSHNLFEKKNRIRNKELLFAKFVFIILLLGLSVGLCLLNKLLTCSPL